MSRHEVHAKSRAEMLENYPIEGKRPNWYFRVHEVSNNAWLVEGSDVWGRKVSRSGGDPDALLAACIEDAGEVAARTER